jgi:hypothetical protein
MSRRLYRAKAGADGQHSDLFGLLLCVRPGARCRDAGRDALRARSGNGRRVERPGQRSLPKVGPPSFGPKTISIVQSSWALGFAAAALVPGPVARSCGWRAVFFAGILPAAVTLWIQRSVPESEMWKERRRLARPPNVADRGELSKVHSRGLTRSFLTAVRKAHDLVAAFQLLWAVRLVGTVHVASAIFVVAGRTRRSRFRRDGNDDFDGIPERVRLVPRISQFWLDGRPHWASQRVPSVYVNDISSDSTLCGRRGRKLSC